ncbi:MAG: serine/threonine-protein phosphatase, partial [Lapillicoccus sp.]
ARDNVTVVIADVVDLDTDQAPPTAPQIVGAAAVRDREGRRTRGLPVGPAEKAARLTREVKAKAASGSHPGGADDEDANEDDETTAIQLAEADSPRKARGRALIVALVAVIVLAGAGYAGWSWSQRQLFLGDDDGFVAVYQGVTQDLGPISLSHVTTRSDVAVGDLPPLYQDTVGDRIVVDDRADAEQRIAALRVVATNCRLHASAGTTCGGVPATTTTTTPTTATTTSGTSPPTTTPITTPSVGATPSTAKTTGSTP